MDIARVQFVSVPVADHVRARDFYVGTLGFELLLDHRGPHGQFVMVGPKGAETGLVLVDFDIENASFGGPIHLQLMTDDVDGDVADRRGAGVEVGEPRDMPWGRTASFTDLDGNALSLLQPTEFGARPR
jgi:catechol 2,3-dioxygenase-like lactoylglutathione lyase family enzyme